MTRIAAMIAGLLLVGCPVWFLAVTTIPVAIYGSVLLGIALLWARARQRGLPSFPIEIFMAGIFGVIAALIVFFGGGGLYSLAKYGSFYKGDLWVMLMIFWGVLGSLVSAGMALLFMLGVGRGDVRARGQRGDRGPHPGDYRHNPTETRSVRDA